MAIHSRRPQDPPDVPRITIGAPPSLPGATAGTDTRMNVGKPAERAAADHAGPTVPRAGVEAARTGRPKDGKAAASDSWFIVLLLSAIPMGAVLVLPSAAPILLAVAAAFIVAGVVMFVRRS